MKSPRSRAGSASERRSGCIRESSRQRCPRPALRTIDPERGDLPQHDVTIFFGADISPATWYPRSHATDIALFCDADDPSLLVDRIPELAREGRTPLHLLFKSTAIARRIGLPGCVVESTATPPRARIRQ
jgi:hypothetical protein